MDVVTGNGKMSLSMGAHSVGEAGVPARYHAGISVLMEYRVLEVFLLEWMK